MQQQQRGAVAASRPEPSNRAVEGEREIALFNITLLKHKLHRKRSLCAALEAERASCRGLCAEERRVREACFRALHAVHEALVAEALALREEAEAKRRLRGALRRGREFCVVARKRGEALARLRTQLGLRIETVQQNASKLPTLRAELWRLTKRVADSKKHFGDDLEALCLRLQSFCFRAQEEVTSSAGALLGQREPCIELLPSSLRELFRQGMRAGRRLEATMSADSALRGRNDRMLERLAGAERQELDGLSELQRLAARVAEEKGPDVEERPRPSLELRAQKQAEQLRWLRIQLSERCAEVERLRALLVAREKEAGAREARLRLGETRAAETARLAGRLVDRAAAAPTRAGARRPSKQRRVLVSDTPVSY